MEERKRWGGAPTKPVGMPVVFNSSMEEAVKGGGEMTGGEGLGGGGEGCGP